MSKADITKTDTTAPETPLQQKTELTVQAVDTLMFGSGIGKMIAPMGQMFGLERISIALILPKKSDNMQPFLDCLRWILNTVLDDQVDLDAFTPKLVEAIQVIQAIAKEENG